MPLLTTKNGFHQWYLEQLPVETRKEAEALIVEQEKAVASLESSDEIKQYYVAMGYVVDCKVTYGLPAAMYVTELRSGKPVHPTLRKVAHKMHHAILQKFPFLKMTSDLEIDDWDVRRGLQDISEKE